MFTEECPEETMSAVQRKNLADLNSKVVEVQGKLNIVKDSLRLIMDESSNLLNEPETEKPLEKMLV